MLSVAQHEGNFDSFAEDSAIYLKKTPDSPEALTIVRAECIICFDSPNPTFSNAVFETGYSALEEKCCAMQVVLQEVTLRQGPNPALSFPHKNLALSKMTEAGWKLFSTQIPLCSEQPKHVVSLSPRPRTSWAGKTTG